MMRKLYQIRKRFLFFLIIFFYGGIITTVSPNIEVDFVYKICPVYTIYTNKFLGDHEGVNKGFINLISPKNKNTTVKIHEMTHAKQNYRTCFLIFIFSAFNESYLAQAEAEAYASEFTNPDFILMYANLIHHKYTPNVPIKTIEGYLKKYLKESK